MNQVFYLKYRDTRPSIRVALKEPDPDNPGKYRAHDLTGATNAFLHIWLVNGTKLQRNMVIESPTTSGIVRYDWVAADWDPGSLEVGPDFPPKPGVIEHRLEVEVLGGAGARMTFPNDGYDILRIKVDIGQGS